MFSRVFFIAFTLLWASASQAEVIRIKWKPGDRYQSSQPWAKYGSVEINGWSERFMDGTVEEKGKTAQNGELEGDVLLPKNAKGNPVPFIVFLHGCSGMNNRLKRWSEETASIFLSKGVGVLILDSFKTRGVETTNNGVGGICKDPSQLNWARRRADDAYSALDYLIEKKLAIPDRVYVLGRSNGATTTLLVMNETVGKAHANKFARGFALQPSCLYHKPNSFYAPVHFYLAELDDATSPILCSKLVARFTDGMAKAIVFKGAFHGFEDKVPKHTFNGWRIGYDPKAANSTMRDILSILSGE